jgi:hypothetical protein
LVQVDFMLGSLMSDLGITSGQFEAACADASARMSPQLQSMLFEQVFAVHEPQFKAFNATYLFGWIFRERSRREVFRHSASVTSAFYREARASL